MAGSYWKSKENVKLFFDNFAKTNGFNPQDPDCWYEISGNSLLQQVCLYLRIFVLITSEGWVLP